MKSTSPSLEPSFRETSRPSSKTRRAFWPSPFGDRAMLAAFGAVFLFAAFLQTGCSKDPECGNGEVEEGESCDDGNSVSGDGCENDCTETAEETPYCGDGSTDDWEECDDGNSISGDGCESDCSETVIPSVCGDGILDRSVEQCDDGNLEDGDGCDSECKKGPLVEECEGYAELSSSGADSCEVTAAGINLLITGTILTPSKVYKGGQVAVDVGGTITCVGCDCSSESEGATTLVCAEGVVSPGLINTHDHITYAQNPPYEDTGERYEQRHDWRIGLDGHEKIESSGGASDDAILLAELRFLMSGATSTVSAGSVDGLVRNLDTSDQEDLNQGIVDSSTFPLGDSSGTQLESGCDYPSITTAESIEGKDSFVPHVSEGIDTAARNEFLCLSSFDDGGQDLVQGNSAFVHAVGLTPPDYYMMGLDGTSLIWSPRSNVTLYGDTAQITVAARMGLNIALGTDWLPSGSMNMIRELRCASELNSKYYNDYFSDYQLWRMVTRGAAQSTATDDAIGTLRPGLVADIAIFDGSERHLQQAVVDAEVDDVLLVLRGGQVLYGDSSIVDAMSTDCDAMDVCGVSKSFCLQYDIGRTLESIQTSTEGLYDMFFCETPDNEPSCVPTRPTSVDGSTIYTGDLTDGDRDGDGIADEDDNCPSVFNPVRPVDGGVQADYDYDGVGDVCDVCPLMADYYDCESFDPDDEDDDDIPADLDNCPVDYNPDQADGDADGYGDACDACPELENSSYGACPATIYQVKDGTYPEGTQVSIEDALVTGTNSSGFFLQVKETDEDYQGPEYSGIFCYARSHGLSRGDRVSIPLARVADYYTQIQLNDLMIELVSSLGEADPAPVDVENLEDIATGGALADAYEGVVVRVSDVSVTNIAPPAGAGESGQTNEFLLNDVLRVNDYLYLADPFPTVGESFAAVSGILEFRNENTKIELRDLYDLVAASPTLASFGPESAFARVSDSSSPTFPDPIQVGLARVLAEDTLITVTSADPTSLEIDGGGVTVSAGSLDGELQVRGLQQAEDVVVTASAGESSLDAHVRVLDDSDTPTLISLDPEEKTITSEATVTFTVTLDMPAPEGGTEVALATNPEGAGTIPESVIVPVDQLSTTFDYVDGAQEEELTITATLGDVTLSAYLAIVEAVTDHLVINELDYDQSGGDTGEFVEIYNGTGAEVDLSDFELVLVNGNGNSEYARYSLGEAGILPDRGFLVLASPPVEVDPDALTLSLNASQDNIQNGSPDAVALIRVSTNELVDALSYEGSITSASFDDGTSGVNLVETEGLPESASDPGKSPEQSLIRFPDGMDTDNSPADWKLTETLTPGSANVE